MKIYNKKGLCFGILWTVLGIIGLMINLFSPDEFLLERIKDLVISVAVILVGSSGLLCAFSKEATRADKISQQDERSSFVKLKTKSLTLKSVYGCLIFITVGGMVAYKITANASWISTFTISAILLGFMILVETVVGIYYEKHI